MVHQSICLLSVLFVYSVFVCCLTYLWIHRRLAADTKTKTDGPVWNALTRAFLQAQQNIKIWCFVWFYCFVYGMGIGGAACEGKMFVCLCKWDFFFIFIRNKWVYAAAQHSIYRAKANMLPFLCASEHDEAFDTIIWWEIKENKIRRQNLVYDCISILYMCPNASMADSHSIEYMHQASTITARIKLGLCEYLFNAETSTDELSRNVRKCATHFLCAVRRALCVHAYHLNRFMVVFRRILCFMRLSKI